MKFSRTETWARLHIFVDIFTDLYSKYLANIFEGNTPAWMAHHRLVLVGASACHSQDPLAGHYANTRTPHVLRTKSPTKTGFLSYIWQNGSTSATVAGSAYLKLVLVNIDFGVSTMPESHATLP
jgi:hypothetical protein